MKILNYLKFSQLNEIQFNKSLPYDFDKVIGKEKDEFGKEINYIEFEYLDKVGNKKIVSVDFLFIKSNMIKYYDNLKKNIDNYLFQYSEKIGDDVILIWFWERNFGESRKSLTYVDENIENSFLFRKMKTIIDIIRYISMEFKVNWFIFQSAENSLKSGIDKNFNKRNFLYSTYFEYFNIKNWFCDKPFVLDLSIGDDNPVIYNFVIFKI